MVSIVKYDTRKDRGDLLHELMPYYDEFFFCVDLHIVFTKIEYSTTYILYDKNEVMGYAVVSKYKEYPSFQHELDTIDIRKNHRGKGYGKIMLNAIKKEYDVLSCQAVNESIGFYAKNGLMPIGKGPHTCQSIMIYCKNTPWEEAMKYQVV